MSKNGNFKNKCEKIPMLKHWNISHGGLSRITNSIFYGRSSTSYSPLAPGNTPDLPSQLFIRITKTDIQAKSATRLSSTERSATAKAEVFPILFKRPQKPGATAQADRDASRRHCNSQATATAAEAIA